MNDPHQTGSLGIDYAEERIVKRASRYRLERRSYEVITALCTYFADPPGKILDLGTADGQMLNRVKKRYPEAHCVGIEYSRELVRYGQSKYPEIGFLRADVQELPFSAISFDAALITAVIEHVPDPKRVIGEVFRVLKPGGLLIMTSPDPFWEYVATKVGHLNGDQHHQVLNITELGRLLDQNGFEVLISQKFMLSPVGLPCELFVEAWIRRLRLDFMMANQLIVANRA